MKQQFSEDDIEKLNSLSLQLVMENNGFNVIRTDNKHAWYLCPFHNETEPSFVVSLQTKNAGYDHQSFYCFGCQTKGCGAISLQQKILESQGLPENKSFIESCRILTEMFSLNCTGSNGDYNDIWHRSSEIEPVQEFSYVPYSRLFSIKELRSLGCICKPIVCDNITNNKCEEQKDNSCDADSPNFSFGWSRFSLEEISQRLHEQFNLFSVKECSYPVTEKKSIKEVSTENFPVFVFKYEDENGWWCRKYEPLYKKKSKGKSYKFTWWKSKSTSKRNLNNKVYADKELKNALNEIEKYKGENPDFFMPKCSNEEGFHPVIEVERLVVDANTGEVKKNKRTRVFGKVVICSGPRDAINVYMHSDAHVIFPHSEHSSISQKTIKQLLRIANKVYVCFDIDSTGRKAQNELCLRNLDLIPIYLPDDLSKIFNQRSGKYCKDVTEYFNLYNDRGDSTEYMFSQILLKSKPLKFWKTSIARHRTEEKSEYIIENKYELDPTSVCLFLQAMGFHSVITFDYKQKTEKVNGYAIVGPYKDDLVSLAANQVEIVPVNYGLSRAKDVMINFLSRYPLSENEATELPNVIVTQRKFTAESLQQLAKRIRLNTVYWATDLKRNYACDKNTEFVFYRNTAVKITPDEIKAIPYEQLNFHVNISTVIQEDFFMPTEEDVNSFIPQVVENNDLDNKRLETNIIYAQAKTHDHKMLIKQQFAQYERLWKLLLKLPENTRFEDLPPMVQWIVDIGRLYWRKEEEGYILTEEEKQRQCMITIIAMHAIGFSLCRYRTKAMVQYVLFTDYNATDETKEAGGTGKSTVLDLLRLVSPVCHIIGQSFRRKENFSKNFDKFTDSVDRVICIDDIRSEVDGSEFNGVTEGLDVKNLYQDEVRIPFDLCPKFVISTNKLKFDASKPSTYRRMLLVPISDYFHPSNISGSEKGRNYVSEFGYDPIKEAPFEERNITRHLVHVCIQLFLRFQQPLEVPVDERIVGRLQQASIDDVDFVEWAQAWFSVDSHFCRPISIREMQLSLALKRGVHPLTEDVVLRGEKQFIKMIDQYIDNCGIRRIDDERVWRKASPNKSNYNGPRWPSWNTQVNAGRFLVDLPRVKASRPCLFFFRDTDTIPVCSSDILNCGTTDPEQENNDS